MNLKNITPIMTSHNTPEPYVISTEDYHWKDKIWKLLSGNDYDAITTINKDVNVIMDFGAATPLYAFSLYYYAIPIASYFAHTAHVYGSNDGINYTFIKTFTNLRHANGEYNKIFYFDKQVRYRYYKFNIINTGSDRITASTIKFYQDEDQLYSLRIKDNVLNAIKNHPLYKYITHFDEE